MSQKRVEVTQYLKKGRMTKNWEKTLLTRKRFWLLKFRFFGFIHSNLPSEWIVRFKFVLDCGWGLVSHRVLTLQAPTSTNKFSRLIFIHFLRHKLREFSKRSKHFLFGDHLINSRNYFSWQRMDMLGENLCWSLLGLKGLKRVRVTFTANGRFNLRISQKKNGKIKTAQNNS